LATFVFLLLVGCSGGPDSEPTPAGSSAEPPAAPTLEPAATATATTVAKPPEQTVEELLASIERGIEEIRGIDAPPPVNHRFVDQAGMKERLAEEFTDPEIIEQLVHESALLKLLGVISQDADLSAIYDGMLGDRVLGLYDPEKEEFFVLGDDQSGADSIDTEAQLTYAHEYVHRLQDAKFDLEKLEDLATGDDMSIAITALVEGDATAAQTLFMLGNYDFAELSRLLESALARQADIPVAPYFLQRALEFPYIEGGEFVSALSATGGNPAINAVFDNPPRSSEQILHPEKYFDGEEPVELDIPDDAMGNGWSVHAENVLGEFFLRTWLEAIGSENAAVAAAGWGGDAYVVFENAAGDFALGVVMA
jgi:hypothetical protein